MQGSLDNYLLGNDGSVTTSVTCMPFIVSKPMEQLLTRNFEILDAFEKHIKTLHMQKDPRISVKESLLKRLEDLLVEVFISQFSLSLFFFLSFYYVLACRL